MTKERNMEAIKHLIQLEMTYEHCCPGCARDVCNSMSDHRHTCDLYLALLALGAVDGDRDEL